jgi:hypothetical protein
VLVKEFNDGKPASERKNPFIDGRFHGILLENARQWAISVFFCLRLQPQVSIQRVKSDLYGVW